MENRNQNLYTALVCIVLLFCTWCFCSIFSNQNQKPNQEFETKHEEQTIEPKIEIEIEEGTPIGETEPKIEVIEAPPIVEAIKTELIKPKPMTSNEVANEVVDNAVPISDVPITDECYYPLSDDDRYIALCIMACECPYEPWEGQVMVAQCILNFMSYYEYSMTTVKQYFDGWNPNLEYADPEAWATLNAAIDEVFIYGNLPTQETVLWFYNPNICTSSWHESQKFVTEICCHRFFAPWD